MGKNKLLLLPFTAGVLLLVYAWFTSYPLTIDSLGDYVFNHVSPFYWVGLSLTLASLFIAGITSKSHVWKWILAVSLVTAMFSISYYYALLPGSDSQGFRGLSEYYINVSRTPTEPYRTYFEWPAYFMLNNMATVVTGLQLIQFEFVLYAMIGFLMVSALYVYFSKSWKNGAFVAVAAFFLAIYYFLNYQAVPFSLAFALFLIMLMKGDELFDSRGGAIVGILLFVTMTFSHAFVPLFFILYEFVWYLMNRKRLHFRLFLLTLALYFVVQLYQAPLSFADRIRAFLAAANEYGRIVQATLAPATNQIDVLAQTVSRTLVVVTVIICAAGFLTLVAKRKLGGLDKVIFISGALYSGVGIVFSVLGSRALPLLFMPVALGACYLLETRFKQLLKAVLLILLVLFPFIVVHLSFATSEIMFQTKESYATENFMLSNYDWTHLSLLLAHTRVITYMRAKENGLAIFESDFSTAFPRIRSYDAMLYTVGLGINLEKYNFTTDRIFHEEMLNRVYDGGQSYIAIKSYNLTWAPVFR